VCDYFKTENPITGTYALELVSIAKRGVIRPIVPNRFKLNWALEALEMLKDRKIMGRGVIINP
jgi:alcohol dehydrogenase, propanol-preferring